MRDNEGGDGLDRIGVPKWSAELTIAEWLISPGFGSVMPVKRCSRVVIVVLGPVNGEGFTADGGAVGDDGAGAEACHGISDAKLDDDSSLAVGSVQMSCMMLG